MSAKGINLGILNNSVSPNGLLYILGEAQGMAEAARIHLRYDGIGEDEREEKEQELQAYISKVQAICECIEMHLEWQYPTAP